MKGCDCIFGKTFLGFFFFSSTRKELGLGESQVLLEMRLTSGIKIVCVCVGSIYIYICGWSILRNVPETWMACKSLAKDLLPLAPTPPQHFNKNKQ